MTIIIPYFQPIVDTWTNTIIGYESTIKGNENESARSLFRRAFSMGTTVELDQQARKLSIEQGLKILQEDQKLFINISPQSVTEVHHTEWWGREVDSIPFDKIVLELTESAPVNIKKFKKDLAELHKKGLRLAIDDFGRGYTNYEVLAKTGNIEYIKLDKLFADNCYKSRYNTIIKHILRLSQDMNTFSSGEPIKVIVEGIETENQKEQLQELGVRYMQGFLFGRPQPAETYQINIKP